MHLKKSFLILTALAVLACLALGGCETTGKVLQGTGNVFNRAGGAVGRL